MAAVGSEVRGQGSEVRENDETRAEGREPRESLPHYGSADVLVGPVRQGRLARTSALPVRVVPDP